MEFPSDHKRIIEKTKLAESELKEWKKVADNMYFPVSKDLGYTCNKMAFRQRFSSVKIWMQHKDQLTKMVLGPRIAFPYIKQADVCNAFISLKNISKEELKRNFFYESFTCMKALSPCVHSIQAASLDKMDMAYTFT
jgi:maltose phosphorylase